MPPAINPFPYTTLFRSLRGRPCFALCAHDELAERLGREQARNVGDFHRRLEAGVRDLAQIGPELCHPFLGHDTLLLELGFGQIAARVLDDLAPRYLDLEGALEAKDHVEKIDRLGVQSLD